MEQREPPALPAPGSVKKTSSRRSMTPERTGSSARRASPAAMAAAVPSRGDNPLQPEYYGGSAEAPQPEPEPEMLYSTKSNAAKVEAEKTKEGIGVPKSTIMVCGVCSLITIVGLAIYIGFQKTDSNGVPHDEREPHAWLSEVDASNPLHMACNDSYNNFTAKCEPTIQEAAAAAPDPSVFTTCNRAACSGNGDCVNGDDPATARCACDENYLGFLCEEEGSVISIAGRSLGACPTPACGADAGEEALAEGEVCPSCQDYLNEMMDACVEHDIPWFHEMEDDVQLPTRARVRTTTCRRLFSAAVTPMPRRVAAGDWLRNAGPVGGAARGRNDLRGRWSSGRVPGALCDHGKSRSDDQITMESALRSSSDSSGSTKNLAGRATCATRWRCCARTSSCTPS